MLKATTLVHKGALEIATHSIRTFAHFFSETHTLNIHTDPSIDLNDHKILLGAAKEIEAKIITANERENTINNILIRYPKTKAFLNRTSYFAKLEIPMMEEKPYFFFDSDVIWLRHATNLEPQKKPNAFSTESWTSYNGIAKPKHWIRAKVPRRINSGFHYISQDFPHQKLEDLLAHGMFDKTSNYAGDQEIFAYLFNEMEYYHPKDLRRSRVGSIYNLTEESCAAIHFAGRMWRPHLDQIKQLPGLTNKPSSKIRYLPSVNLTSAELIQMRVKLKLGKSSILAKPLNIFRKILRPYR